MTSELAAAAISYLLGWGVLRPFSPQSGISFTLAAALPAGMSLWVLISALVLVMGISFDPLYPTILSIGIAAAVSYRWAENPSKVEFSAVGAGLLVLIALVAIFVHLDMVKIGSDGLWTLYLADELSFAGEFSNGTRILWVAKIPYFLPLVSSAAVTMGLTNFISLQPLIAICGLILFGLLGQRALQANDVSRLISWGLPAVAILALASIPSMSLHAFLFKTHGLVMVHMLVAGAALYIGARENSIPWFIITLLFTSTLVFMRPEAGVSALPILVVAAAAKYVSLRLRLVIISGISLFWASWYVYLVIMSIYFDGFVISQVYTPLVLVGMVPGLFGIVLLTGFAIHRNPTTLAFVEHAIAVLPRLMIAVLVIAFLLMVAENTHHATSIIHSTFCTLVTPDSGTFGFGIAVIPLVVIMPFLSNSAPNAKPIFYVILGYLLLLPLAFSGLTFFTQCSADVAPSRTLSHILPLALFYVMIKLGTASLPSKTAGR